MSGDYGSYLPNNISPEEKARQEEHSRRVDLYHKRREHKRHDAIIQNIKLSIEKEFGIGKPTTTYEGDLATEYQHPENKKRNFIICWDYDPEQAKDFILDLEYMLVVYENTENEKDEELEKLFKDISEVS